LKGHAPCRRAFRWHLSRVHGRAWANITASRHTIDCGRNRARSLPAGTSVALNMLCHRPRFSLLGIPRGRSTNSSACSPRTASIVSSTFAQFHGRDTTRSSVVTRCPGPCVGRGSDTRISPGSADCDTHGGTRRTRVGEMWASAGMPTICRLRRSEDLWVGVSISRRPHMSC
jgi:hypothetical protein